MQVCVCVQQQIEASQLSAHSRTKRATLSDKKERERASKRDEQHLIKHCSMGRGICCCRSLSFV